jgi:hypothetical protein
LIGRGSDNIISARLISAEGSIVEANETTNPDLLWALRGAGQFFGLVLELGIQTYPYSLLGTAGGSHSMTTFIFAPAQAEAVCHAINQLVSNKAYATAGHCMVVCPPPAFQPGKASCPDTARSGYTVEWHSAGKTQTSAKGSFGNVERMLLAVSLLIL